MVCKLGSLFGSVCQIKIHNIKAVTGKEQGDLEIKDYVVLQKSKEQANRLTLIGDFRAKILHYRQMHLNRPDPIVFMPE